VKSSLESIRARMRGKAASVAPVPPEKPPGPAILIIDIETMPGLIEKFDLKPSYISKDFVVVPTRILCFAAKWYGAEDMLFYAAWNDDDQQAYANMAQAAWDLFDQADVIIGWNSTRFDIKHFHSAYGRLKLGPPSPSRSLDLMMVARKNFNEMSYALDWFGREWLGERKIKTNIELWQHIRRGTEAQRATAQEEMEEYNKKDVTLTEKLFENFRPWTGVNFALLDPDLDDFGRLSACPKCQSSSIQSRGKYFTNACAYDRYRCNDCGGWSRGKKMVFSTEMRPV
jgi:hypothetical protein